MRRVLSLGSKSLRCQALTAVLACAAGLFILSRSMVSVAASRQAAATGALKSFVQSIPGSAAQVRMVAVPGGLLTIGGGARVDRPFHVKPFWIASTETPWEVFDAFANSGPPAKPYDQTRYAPDAIARPSKSYIPPDMGWGHHGYPVIHESFLSAQMFCRWLSSKTGKHYRLPTTLEWEYAAWAGARGPWKMTDADLAKRAWYAANSDQQTHPVGKKLSNAWGLYDVFGNVGEWCTQPDGTPVLCGGSYADNPAQLGPNARARQTPDWQATDPQIPKSRWWLSDAHFAGFRIVCEP